MMQGSLRFNRGIRGRVNGHVKNGAIVELSLEKQVDVHYMREVHSRPRDRCGQG
jgi:hypothetical protein